MGYNTARCGKIGVILCPAMGKGYSGVWEFNIFVPTFEEIQVDL